MTREEAIEMIASMGKYMSSGNPIWKTEPVKEATNMAIEALKEKNRSDSLVRDDAENCKESESKLDLISRQDAIKTVIRMCSPICDWELEKKAYTDCVIDEINSLPSAEPKTGEWIQKDMYADRFCSECNYAVWDSEAEEYNFCPNCGARMLGEDG